MKREFISKSGVEVEVGIDNKGEITVSLSHSNLGEIAEQNVVYDGYRQAFCWQVNRQTAGVTFHEQDTKIIKDESEKMACEWRDAVVPGLDELRDAYYDVDAYIDKFNKMMEDENNDGCCPPKGIDIDIVEELEKKYPAAAAYIVAESYEGSSWFIKSAAGSRAAERIMAGEEHGIVMVDMQKEIDAGIDYNN